MQYLVVICALFYLLSGHGCQMPESRGTAKQPGYHGGNETPYTIQRADDARRQRENEQAKTDFWNNYWHQKNVDRVNHQKAVRDQFRQQEIDAEYKARQMLIDKALQEFQKSLDNPQPKKKGW